MSTILFTYDFRECQIAVYANYTPTCNYMYERPDCLFLQPYYTFSNYAVLLMCLLRRNLSKVGFKCVHTLCIYFMYICIHIRRWVTKTNNFILYAVLVCFLSIVNCKHSLSIFRLCIPPLESSKMSVLIMLRKHACQTLYESFSFFLIQSLIRLLCVSL